ncbi:MAG: hypothetical protein ACI906_004841 [Candidatus Latescibacterota bacterium]|jgi:hypothetical protein
MSIWRCTRWHKVLVATLLCSEFLVPRDVTAIESWQVGDNGLDWEAVGALNGLTTAGTSLLPAVVDSTTNALSNLDLKRRGGSISSPQASNVDLTGLLTDGNLATFWRVERERRPDGTSMIIDLGAILPINRIRFQGSEDAFLRAYEIFVHDGNIEQLREDRPVAFIDQVDANLEQADPLIEAEIPLQFVRFIRLISRSGQEFIIEEAEVFGNGFAPTGSYTSEVVDLGAAANFGKIQLQASIDSLTSIVLQTRSGIVPDPTVYYGKTEIFQGEERAEEVILPRGFPEASEAYFDLRSADRGAIEDNIVEWSPWSAPYENFDSDFVSPGNRRYVQFRLVFSSDDARQSAIVEHFNFQYSSPTLADELTAEISPGDVTLGESHTFDYYIRSSFENANEGFDRIEILTPFAATVSAVELDGIPVDYVVDEEQTERIAIQLTQDRVNQSEQLLHIRFDGLVTVYGTTFFAKVFDSEKDELGQDVVPGDASPEAESNRLSIQGRLRSELVLDLSVSPQTFTPNGDGINDELQVSYILLRALQEVPVDLSLYDLSGRPVRKLQNSGAINGPQQLKWDGRDESGNTVPPGLYLLRLSIDTDTGSEDQTLTVGVAY